MKLYVLASDGHGEKRRNSLSERNAKHSANYILRPIYVKPWQTVARWKGMITFAEISLVILTRKRAFNCLRKGIADVTRIIPIYVAPVRRINLVLYDG